MKRATAHCPFIRFRLPLLSTAWSFLAQLQGEPNPPSNFEGFLQLTLCLLFWAGEDGEANAPATRGLWVELSISQRLAPGDKNASLDLAKLQSTIYLQEKETCQLRRAAGGGLTSETVPRWRTQEEQVRRQQSSFLVDGVIRTLAIFCGGSWLNTRPPAYWAKMVTCTV